MTPALRGSARDNIIDLTGISPLAAIYILPPALIAPPHLKYTKPLERREENVRERRIETRCCSRRADCVARSWRYFPHPSSVEIGLRRYVVKLTKRKRTRKHRRRSDALR